MTVGKFCDFNFVYFHLKIYREFYKGGAGLLKYDMIFIYLERTGIVSAGNCCGLPRLTAKSKGRAATQDTFPELMTLWEWGTCVWKSAGVQLGCGARRSPGGATAQTRSHSGLELGKITTAKYATPPDINNFSLRPARGSTTQPQKDLGGACAAAEEARWACAAAERAGGMWGITSIPRCFGPGLKQLETSYCGPQALHRGG